MKKKHKFELVYLERLLNAYIKLVPWDDFSITVEENDTPQCYIRIEFYKRVVATTSENHDIEAYNKSERRYMVTELHKAVMMFKQKLREKFKKRHEL